MLDVMICGDISPQLMLKETLCTFANTVQNVQNATKMQNHLAKHIKFSQSSQQATSDKSPSTSIRGENDESDTLSIATAYGPPGIRSFFDSMESGKC